MGNNIPTTRKNKTMTTTRTLTADHLESFRSVYRLARDIYHDIDDSAKHSPIDPVIRFEDRGLDISRTNDGMCWLLDSAIYDNEHTALMCPLESFHAWFCESYDDEAYIPSFADMQDFAETIDSE